MEITRKIGRYIAPTSSGFEITREIGRGYNEINGGTYLLGKVGAGAASVLTGAYNFIAGAFDQITGNTYAAEKRYAENDAQAFSKKLDSMYNANGAMQFLGSVAEGVGQSIPAAMLSAIPFVGKPLAMTTMVTGYTGMNVQEAYQNTGNLGAREYVYGAVLGIGESALDWLGGKAGGWIGGFKPVSAVKGAATKGVGAVASAAAKKGTLGAAKVAGNVLKGGASEFAEEFIESYAEVGLKRALDIDPNASITFGEALYAGAVGFASGGMMSGSATILNTRGAANLGKRAMNAGEADMTIAAATEIASAFKSSGVIEENAVQTLRDNLALWERTENKTGTQAQMLLGNIRLAMTQCEVYAAQSGTYKAVTSNPEKFLDYARAVFGNKVTLDDLKSRDSQVVRYIAAVDWATGEVEKLSIRAEKAKMAEYVKAENDGRNEMLHVRDANWQGENAVYALGNGEHVFIVGKNGNYSLMVGEDTDNVKAYAKDGKSTVLSEDEVREALAFLTAQSAVVTPESAVGTEARAAEAAKAPEQAKPKAEKQKAPAAKEAEGAKSAEGVKYSISEKNQKHAEDFQKRIEAWDGKTEGFSFVMGETPSYLSDLEVNGKKIGKKQVRIDATKIKKIVQDHPEMTTDVIKNLPYLLNDPILVLDSKTVKGRLVLLGEVYANGKPVMMALEINPTTRSGNSTYVDVIKVASAYPRANTQNMINASNIRFVNENKSRVDNWLKVNRLQLPLPNTQLNSATNSIVQNDEKVKGDAVKKLSKNSLAAEGEKTAVKGAEKKSAATEGKTEERPTGKDYASESGKQTKKHVLTDEVKRNATRVIDEYSAATQDKARKLVKNVDKLSAERRIAIYETIESGQGIDTETLRAACAFESGRKGLFLYFNREINARFKDAENKTPDEGFHAVVDRAGTRLVAIAKGLLGVRQTVGHEIFHDIRKSGAGKELESYALKTGDEERMLKTAKLYADHFAARFKGVAKWDTFYKKGKFASVREAVYAYDEKYGKRLGENSLAEEVAAKEIGAKLGTKRFMKRITRVNGGASRVLRVLGSMKAFLSVREGGKFLSEVRRLEQLYLRAARDAEVQRQMSEMWGQRKNSVSETGTSDAYGVSITKEQMTKNARQVTNMKEVAILTGNEFAADGKSSLATKVVEFFKSFGHQAETQELGTVAVTKSSFRDDKGHGLTRNKIVSFKAIPEVLQNGRVIDIYKPEGKPYARITLAAPIRIGEDKYYMGVMVQRDMQSNRMYLHDVITEKAPSSFTNGANRQNGEGIRDEGHLFITSILEKSLLVKDFEQTNSGNGQINVKNSIAASGKNIREQAKANQSHVFTQAESASIVDEIAQDCDVAWSSKAKARETVYRGLNTVHEGGLDAFRRMADDLASLARVQESGKAVPLSSVEQVEVAERIERILLSEDAKSQSKTPFGETLKKLQRLRADAYWAKTEMRKAQRVVYGTTGAILNARDLAKMISERKYLNAAHLDAPEMREMVKILSKLATRRGIREENVREAMKLAQGWYTLENIDPDGQSTEDGESATSIYLPAIKEMISGIANGQGNLSAEEISDLAKILAHIKHIYTKYDSMILEGKKVSVEKNATNELRLLNGYFSWDEKRKTKFLKHWHSIRNSYLFGMLTPRQVISTLEFFDKDGVLTKIYEDVQNGLAAANSDYADLMTPLVAFFDEHKKYDGRLSKERIEYQGASITYGQAIALYLTTFREQAKLGLEETGISFMGEDGKVHRLGGRKVEDIRTDIEGHLNSDDTAYIKVVKALFEKAREMKVETDLEAFGFTNIEDGFYFPIERDEMARAKSTSDTRKVYGGMQVVGNKSFNKTIRKNAKQRLFIGDVTAITGAHAQGVSQYKNLYSPLQSWDKVWNKSITSENGETHTVRELVNDRIFTGFGKRGEADKYFAKLFADIQGVREALEPGSGFYDVLRTSYVTAALGLNPSSMLKQTASFGSASLYLGWQDLMRAAVMRTDVEQMRKYSKVANGRLFDRTRIVDAETNITGSRAWRWLRETADLTTRHIQWADDFVVGKLWNACRLYIERTKGLSRDSEENLVEAGKLLDRVINETQSTSTADTRSAYQRGGKIMQTFMMFSSDSTKMFSYLYEGVMRVYMSRQRVKMGIGTEEDVKRSKQFAKRAAVGFLAATAIAVGVTQLIKFIRAQDREEDESLAEDIGKEAIGQMIGLFPVVSDIYELFGDGYEIENFAVGLINDVGSSAVAMRGMIADYASGKQVDEKTSAKAWKNAFVSVGHIFGLPVRTVHNYATGLSKRFAPTGAYGYYSRFSNTSYSEDLAKAVEAGDEDLALHIMEIMIKRQKTGGTLDSAAATEMLSLYSQGYEVLADGIPTKYKGADVTRDQAKQMERIYGKADSVVERMTASEVYADLTDKERAKAIQNVYSAYLAKAKGEVLGAKVTAATLMVDLIDPALLAATLGKISSFEETEQATRSEQVTAYLNSLEISNDERYIILFAAGYRSKTVKAAITRLAKKASISEANLAAILAYTTEN